MMCICAELLLSDGAASAAERQVQAADLPESIDVGPLRGKALRAPRARSNVVWGTAIPARELSA
jgi:hypothetical protein